MAQIGSRSAGWPARWTGMIAFVRSVTPALTASGSMFRSDSRTSTKTGVAPAWTTTFAVAGQVIGVVITSSPGPIPSATRVRCIAAVPEETASACFAPTYAAKRRSSSAAFGPVVSQPERIVRATASISSSPTAGGWNESIVVLRDSSCTGRPEAYESGGRPRPFQSLVPGAAHGLDCAKAVGSVPERADRESRPPVDANAQGAVLDDLRAVPRDPELGVARPVLDSELRHSPAGDLGRITAVRLGRPHVRQRHAECRGVGGEPVGHRQWVEAPVDRERVHRHLRAVGDLLDERVAIPRLRQSPADGLLELADVLDEAQPSLTLPVGRLNDAGNR